MAGHTEHLKSSSFPPPVEGDGFFGPQERELIVANHTSWQMEARWWRPVSTWEYLKIMGHDFFLSLIESAGVNVLMLCLLLVLFNSSHLAYFCHKAISVQVINLVI